MSRPGGELFPMIAFEVVHRVLSEKISYLRPVTLRVRQPWLMVVPISASSFVTYCATLFVGQPALEGCLKFLHVRPRRGSSGGTLTSVRRKTIHSLALAPAVLADTILWRYETLP